MVALHGLGRSSASRSKPASRELKTVDPNLYDVASVFFG